MLPFLKRGYSLISNGLLNRLHPLLIFQSFNYSSKAGLKYLFYKSTIFALRANIDYVIPKYHSVKQLIVPMSYPIVLEPVQDSFISHMLLNVGVEPTTYSVTGNCSTNWANLIVLLPRCAWTIAPSSFEGQNTTHLYAFQSTDLLYHILGLLWFL